MSFRELLRSELSRRQAKNPRYSLRRFASALGIQHSTLSRLLRSQGSVAARTIHALAQPLGLTKVEEQRYCAEEARVAVLDAARAPDLPKDSRHLASRLGISVDAVNVSLQSLLRQRALSMPAHDRWLVNREAQS